MKPHALIIMDGWGIAPSGPGNAIRLSKTPNFDRMWNTYPHTTLSASGISVGLPEHEPGNTETGHINIGAGRVIYQDLLRINTSIEDGSFFTNEAFLGAIRYAQTHNSHIHIMGILSDAGVHASRNHLCALLKLLHDRYQGEIYLHLFSDGRDSLPKSALSLFKELENHCLDNSHVHIASVIGRYYAMDRDKRWERTEQAYTALTHYSQYTAKSVEEAIQKAYERHETDEFIKPTVILSEDGQPYPRISDNDSVIFFNYRIDRPRQLTRAFVLPDFETRYQTFSFDPYMVKYYKKHNVEENIPSKPFNRLKIIKNLFFVTMTEYEQHMPCIVAYPTITVQNPLGKVLYDHNIRQLRIAESEKERFVTYYFNGMREEPYPNEDRLIIPSPKIPTYDLMPQMSALEITQSLVERLSLNIYGAYIVNFANPDMVAHTGNITASIKACETVDTCIGIIAREVLSKNGSCIITADHGNVEEMLTDSGGMETEHSINPVPMIIVFQKLSGHHVLMQEGKLGDIAPTMLALMGIKKPPEMTGVNLLDI